MTVDPYIVDAEIVDDATNTRTRRIIDAARERARVETTPDALRQRTERARTDAALVTDGVRGRVLARRERERLAEYRHNGNPDAPVREDMRSHYERARDRQNRADADTMTLDDAMRYGAWGTFGLCELLFCAWLVGGLSGGYWMLAALIGVGNVIGGTVMWKRLRHEGSAYRAKVGAWELGQAPSDNPDDDHSAASLTAVFVQAGIVCSPDSGGEGLTLTEPVSSDGRSFTARVVLPGGGTVGQVRGKLSRLASAFDVYPPQIQIGSGGSERRLVLTVFRELPFTGAPVRSPLASSEARALSAGVPLGLDINGAPVVLDIERGRHGLVVASAGNGKSVLLQNLASATVLDVTASLTLLDGKPDGSYTEFEELSYGVVTTADEDYLERAADLLEALCDRMEAKLARSKKGEDIPFDVIILDEFQEWTGNVSSGGMSAGSPKQRIRAALDRLARRGRSARMRLVLASQDYDGRNIDDAVLTNVGWRAIGYAPSKMSREALGTLADQFGLDTSSMFVDEVQAGTSLVAGGGIHPYKTMRSYLPTPADRASIAATAQRLRAAAPQATETARAPADGAQLEASTDAAALDDATVALLRGVLEVYDGDDAAWIPTETLVSEVVVGELGRTHDRATSMDVARVLGDMGAYKRRASELGTHKPMSWHRSTLVDVARQALGEQ